MYLLQIIWCISLIILIGYHLLIFRIRKKNISDFKRKDAPGVSIVIAVKNGGDAFVENLHHLLSQDYPTYEILVVDDHSEKDEMEKLEALTKELSQVFLYRSNQAPGKKQALAIGIEKANHDLILCTDADCRPNGTNWIQRMVESTDRTEIVLGYSPYVATTGLLNLFIRFETVMTGIQYLSWAIIGKPYMGVGRNMLYPRQLFQKLNPYADQQGIPYGDDDLWIQRASSIADVQVSFDKASHVYSIPASTWSSWFRQKHRHLSAGHHYPFNAWWKPGVYGLALIIHWLLMPLIFIAAFKFWIVSFFLFGLFIRWYTHWNWTRKLGDRDTTKFYPFLEVAYAIYLVVVGLFTAWVKKKSWN